MKTKFEKLSLRWRITILNVSLLTLCTVALAIILNFSAFRMADTIQASPLTPATPEHGIEDPSPLPFTQVEVVDIARADFRMHSLLAVLTIIGTGGIATYYFAGKALEPLSLLSNKMKKLSISNLSKDLELPKSEDEIRELTESFNKMSHNLDHAFINQKNFSQSAAHELRTPLAVLKTKIEVFKMKPNRDTEEYNNLIKTFETQVDRLILLVNNLLKLSNFESINTEENFNITELIDCILIELKPIIDKKDISISTSIKAQQTNMTANRTLMLRAFHNLIENAVLHNFDGGWISIEVNNKDANLEVLISNSGPLIAAVDQEKIFESFYKVNQDSNGHGIGLATVKNVIELHQGTIKVLDGDETCFQVLIKV